MVRPAPGNLKSKRHNQTDPVEEVTEEPRPGKWVQVAHSDPAMPGGRPRALCRLSSRDEATTISDSGTTVDDRNHGRSRLKISRHNLETERLLGRVDWPQWGDSESFSSQVPNSARLWAQGYGRLHYRGP